MYIVNWMVGKDVHTDKDLINKKDINVWTFGPFDSEKQAKRFLFYSNIDSGYNIQKLHKPMIPNSKEFPMN